MVIGLGKNYCSQLYFVEMYHFSITVTQILQTSYQFENHDKKNPFLCESCEKQTTMNRDVVSGLLDIRIHGYPGIFG